MSHYEIYRCPDCEPEIVQTFEDAKNQACDLAESLGREILVYKRNDNDLLEYQGSANPFRFGGCS